MDLTEIKWWRDRGVFSTNATAMIVTKTCTKDAVDWLISEVDRLKKIEVAAKAIADHAEEIEFDDAMGFATSLDYLSALNSALDGNDSPACSTCRHYKMPCTQNQHFPDCTGYVAESV